jgi:hypothetical protein
MKKKHYFTLQWGRGGASEVAEVYGVKDLIILVNYLQSYR